MKAGDKVKCIKVDHMWGGRVSGHFGYIQVGKEYIIEQVLPRGNNGYPDPCVTLVKVGQGFEYPQACFELIDTVEVTITGTLIGRSREMATIKLAEGNTVILPARLVPEDERLTAKREEYAKFAEKCSRPAFARAIRGREFDDRIDTDG